MTPKQRYDERRRLRAERLHKEELQARGMNRQIKLSPERGDGLASKTFPPIKPQDEIDGDGRCVPPGYIFGLAIIGAVAGWTVLLGLIVWGIVT